MSRPLGIETAEELEGLPHREEILQGGGLELDAHLLAETGINRLAAIEHLA